MTLRDLMDSIQAMPQSAFDAQVHLREIVNYQNMTIGGELKTVPIIEKRDIARIVYERGEVSIRRD